MAKFTNDLSSYILLVQQEEMFESIEKRHIRRSKELAVKLAIATGSIVSVSTIGIAEEKPLSILATAAILAISNSLYNLYIKHKHLKEYKIELRDIESVDYKKIARYHREEARYNGTLPYRSPFQFELVDKEEIEEEFGYQTDNDLPVQFLEQELVAERVIHEYELYSQRYGVPALKISKETLNDFVNKFAELLKTVNLSHRIYFYTSEYFKRLISKGLINYWEEINMDTIISNLNIFECIGILPYDIENFKEQFNSKETSKKLK